jgi:hypothetical protein
MVKARILQLPYTLYLGYFSLSVDGRLLKHDACCSKQFFSKKSNTVPHSSRVKASCFYLTCNYIKFPKSLQPKNSEKCRPFGTTISTCTSIEWGLMVLLPRVLLVFCNLIDETWSPNNVQCSYEIIVFTTVKVRHWSSRIRRHITLLGVAKLSEETTAAAMKTEQQISPKPPTKVYGLVIQS